jgi:hypothetical protein
MNSFCRRRFDADSTEKAAKGEPKRKKRVLTATAYCRINHNTV